MSYHKERIVIIGGGFGGINLARKLAGCNHYQIVLVDSNNYNFFAPLLYQVATGFLETSNISYPFRKLFSGQANFRFRMGRLLSVNTDEQKVLLTSGELYYDHLVFATGTETSYFGLENVKKYAIPMKTLDDALQMRNTLLERLELATITKDEEERTKLLTMVIAGGGPTGVEISGMLAELKNTLIKNEYPELEGAKGEICLVNGAGELLSPMSVKSQEYTYKSLEKLGVRIILNTRVKDFDGEKVVLANNDFIKAKTLIWATGVSAKVFEGIPIECYGQGKRLICNEFNEITGLKNIYAIGDTCIQTHQKEYPNGHPQVAQVAIQQGRNLATNFISKIKNQVFKPFNYHDKGSMAIIGRNKAVADFPKSNLHFKGFSAWFMWLFVHLLSLINYRNRVKTLYNWTVAYFTKDQSLRMIVRPLIKNK